jgi:lambda repressor-like predicted transcriptional regulator
MTDEELKEFIAQKIAEKKAAAIARASKKITPEQGLYIKYRLKCMGTTGAEIALEAGCTPQSVSDVLSGKSHSQRIERAVASRLGYKSWNDMVTELREKAA